MGEKGALPGTQHTGGNNADHVGNLSRQIYEHISILFWYHHDLLITDFAI